MSIKAADMREFTYLSNPKTNPSRFATAFVVSRPDYDNNKYTNKLFYFDGFALQPLTEAGTESSFLWEDDSHILFRTPNKNRYTAQTAEKKENEAPVSHYYRISIDGGEAGYAFSIPLSVDNMWSLPQANKFLVLASYDISLPDLWQKTEEERQTLWGKLQAKNWHEHIAEIPFQSNGVSGYSYNDRSALFFYDSVSEELELVSDDYPNWTIDWLSFNKDKTKCLFGANVFENENDQKLPMFHKLYELDIENAYITCLYDKLDHQLGDGFYIETLDEKLQKTSYEEIILISSDTKICGINENNYFYQYNPQTKELVKLADHEIQYGSSVGSDARYGGSAVKEVYNGHLDLIETENTEAVLYRYYFIDSRENTDVSRETFVPLALAQELVLAADGSVDGFFALNLEKEWVKEEFDLLDSNSDEQECCCADSYSCTSEDAQSLCPCIAEDEDESSTHCCQTTDSHCDLECEDCTYEQLCAEADCCSADESDIDTMLAEYEENADYANNAESIFTIGLFNNNLPEIYLVDAPDKPARITYFNDLAQLYDVVNPQVLSMPGSTEGDTIDGFVLFPPNFDSTKIAAYPLILDIHGGPKTVYGSVYYHEMQVWAHMGFVVCFANPHGSDGKGNAFSDIRGAYGEQDYRDLMAFVDHVLAKYPAIDKERMGVTGGSYGGFMTNWIIGHTKRFKVAATQRSISNWLSFYGTSDIGFYFATDQNGVADFSSDSMAKMWEHSPLKYVNDVETPTLIIHSDEDYRCPLEQGMQWYTALKARNVPCEIVIFHGENHDLSRSGKPKAREQRLNLLSHWFVKYLQADNKELLEELERAIYE